MFAELVINVEAPLANTFHYRLPRDLIATITLGHLVEVEFGRRLAQGIVVGLDTSAPVEDTKPIITLVTPDPVITPWQIDLARWLHQHHLAPFNACLRLMLPPGLTRWSDITVDLNPYWDGNGRLTELQQHILTILREKGDLRGRQLERQLRKIDKKIKRDQWKTAVSQLDRRNIIRKASVLDPPRAKPKQIRTAALIASPEKAQAALLTLGRQSKKAAVLAHLLTTDDPLPSLTAVLNATNATQKQLQALANEQLITLAPKQLILTTPLESDHFPKRHASFLRQLPLVVPEDIEQTHDINTAAFPLPHQQRSLTQYQKQGLIEPISQPAAVSLAVTHKEAFTTALRLRGATTYQALINHLIAAAQPVNVSDLYAQHSANINHLRKLVKLDLIRLGDQEVWRDPLADRDFTPAEPPLLTADQARVWGRIKVAMLDAEDELGNIIPPVPFLLHGVTGSGKTEIYMRAIDFALQNGQQAIVLVPEIALTPQTVRRFAARFPGRVAVLHSRLSDGERYDTWRRAREGLFDIVVGPRSALFTPFPRLGVIVVDEEHDPSYKQTPPVPPPYYHARDAAIALANIVGATVIMGSATPDVVTYHRARSEQYQLVELPRRVMGHRKRINSQAERLQVQSRYEHLTDDPDDAVTIPLPPIQVVDLRQELRAGNRSIFSRALDRALTETLERGEQAIIFLNRRGSATFIICRDCGYVQKCARCDLPLTYHQRNMLLVCHHCNRREPVQTTCPKCESKRIRYFGLGTQEVVERVKRRWPQARVTRWDRDTTAGKNTHENLLAAFVNQEANVLVGTQMIAKGLDLPLVTLVGVISADVSLGLPDFKTGERAFQILAQVAGRAGRGLLGGQVIMQTYKPEHYAIQAAADHDFTSFYLDEIRFRTQHSLPPFRRMAKLVWVDPVNDRGKREAERLTQALKLRSREMALAATEIFGPVPPFFNRVDGRFRWQVIIRSPDPSRLLKDFPIPPKWVVDIDPVSTL